MERKTIIIIIIVVVLCTSLSLFFYLRNASNKSTSSDDTGEKVKDAVAANEATLKAEAKEMYIQFKLKDINIEIAARENMIVSQGGDVDKSIEFSELLSERKSLRMDAESSFDIIYKPPHTVYEREENIKDLINAYEEFSEVSYGGGFPDHWTPRPSIETKDIVQFPLEWGFMYGISGSSTIRNWISSNLERDEASGTIGPSPTNI